MQFKLSAIIGRMYFPSIN